ncbi:hypothetical protein RMB13_19155 [Acinetobacter sp. V102_4]|nr:hypothetical protein [Acinetobacter sp. V102_4]MDS7931562.1 hypothetical protein [Acinetobacter sp. V102_4]
MLQWLGCGLMGILMTTSAIAKTEQIILKKDMGFGEEAVIFSTTQGERVFNYFAFPEKVAQQIKPYKKGQCLEIKSKHGFFNGNEDEHSIDSIRPCPKNGLATPKVSR